MKKNPRKKKFTAKVQAEICKEIVMLLGLRSESIKMTTEDIFIILTELSVSFVRSISNDEVEFKENTALICANIIAMSRTVGDLRKPHDGVVH